MKRKTDRQGPMVATVKGLLAAFAFFRKYPDGRVRVDWCTTWSQSEFRAWFRRCLARKTSGDTRTGRKLTDEYQLNQQLDARIINERARGIYRSGQNLLRTPEMKAAYPNIDRCMTEDEMGEPVVNRSRTRRHSQQEHPNSTIELEAVNATAGRRIERNSL